MPRKKEMGRNANGLGTIRKKTVTRNGQQYTYWEARCTVGYDLGTGKQIQRSVISRFPLDRPIREKIRENALKMA